MPSDARSVPEPAGAAKTERLNTKAAGIVTLAVTCSRILGLVREQVFTALFGRELMDAFTVAFRIPNLLRDLFAEGALSTAFVTTFSKTIVLGGDAAAWKLANKVTTMTLVMLGGLCLIGMLFSDQIVAALAWGFDADKAHLTAHLTRIMFPFILLVSLAALAMGMLNAKNVFGMPAMASSFFNLGSIVGGVLLGYYLDPHFGPVALAGLAFATVFGGALQLLVQLPSVARAGYRFHWDFQWNDPGVKAILLLMGPSVIAASTTQLNVLVNTMFASTLVAGSIIWLSIAFRLMQLPLGLFGVALGTVTLPLLSRLVATGKIDAFRSELAHAMRLGFVLTVPSTVGLMMLAEPIMSVLYQHGRITDFDAAQAGAALRFYAIGLSAYAALKVLVNAFYALDRRKTPMIVSFVAVVLNVLFNWLFTFRLNWGHRGLALSTGLIAMSNFLLLYVLMRAQLKGLETARLLRLLAKLAVGSLGIIGVCAAANQWLLADWPTQGLLLKCGALLVTIGVAMAVFMLLGLALKVEELVAAFAAVKRRLRR